MNYEEYCEQRLDGKSGQELVFQLASDIFTENGIPVPHIPVFLGTIIKTQKNKQYIKFIKSIYKNTELKKYPFKLVRTDKWGDQYIAKPSVTVTDMVDAIDNTTVIFCVTSSITYENAILMTSSEMCISQADLGVASNASEDEIIKRLRERPIFDRIIGDYEEIIKKNGIAKKRKDEEKQLNRIKIEKEKIEGEMETLKGQRDFLIRIGLLEDGKNLQICNKIDSFAGSFSDLIVHVKSHMSSGSKHLIYNDKERIVERFFWTMFTNQLIILSGEPGSGKTSLPVAVAKAIGAKCHLISVQPNWTDNQDLLGFYNPIETRYVSTPFLEALMAACKDPERIHFICLDEMNLAHIEYYFSGILSAMETEEKVISLYAGQNVKELTSIICNNYYPEFSRLDEIKREEWVAQQSDNPELSDLINRWKTANEYPPEICIPANVVFVGTLNMDETTKGISPKVLDRSYIIEINNYDAIEWKNTPQQGEVQAISITKNHFLKLRKSESNDSIKIRSKSISDQIKDILKIWNDQKASKDVDGLRKLQLSKRFLFRQLPDMMEANEPSISLPDILAGKILPLMQCDKMSEEKRKEVEKALTDKCGIGDYVVTKFKRMADDDDSISFWWR